MQLFSGSRSTPVFLFVPTCNNGKQRLTRKKAGKCGVTRARRVMIDCLVGLAAILDVLSILPMRLQELVMLPARAQRQKCSIFRTL